MWKIGTALNQEEKGGEGREVIFRGVKERFSRTVLDAAWGE